MDSTELNKIAAALLCAVAAFFACDYAGAALTRTEAPDRPAFRIVSGDAGGGGQPSAAASIDHRLLTASAGHGGIEAGTLCSACHSFAQGGPTLVGPALYGVAGGPVAAVAGYDYSDALHRVGGRWSPDRLDAWLTRPNRFARGTRMGFAGIADPGARADVVAYLISLSPVAAAQAAPAPASVSGTEAPASAAPSAGVAARVDHADIKTGAATVEASCSACHSFEKDGEVMVGPALYGVFGRPIGHGPDFTYSTALAGHGGVWSVDTLDAWLKSPRHFAPGTKMAFPGIADDGQRAAVVAYLRSLSGPK